MALMPTHFLILKSRKGKLSKFWENPNRFKKPSMRDRVECPWKKKNVR